MGVKIVSRRHPELIPMHLNSENPLHSQTIYSVGRPVYDEEGALVQAEIAPGALLKLPEGKGYSPVDGITLTWLTPGTVATFKNGEVVEVGGIREATWKKVAANQQKSIYNQGVPKSLSDWSVAATFYPAAEDGLAIYDYDGDLTYVEVPVGTTRSGAEVRSYDLDKNGIRGWTFRS